MEYIKECKWHFRIRIKSSFLVYQSGMLYLTLVARFFILWIYDLTAPIIFCWLVDDQTIAIFLRFFKAFHQYFDQSKTSQCEQIDQLLSVTNHPKYKSPDVAKWLSTFLPGSGQIYAGDYWKGLNALGINLGTGYLFINSLLEHRSRDAFIIYLSLFWRYYSGNRQNAEMITQEYNEELSRQYGKQILDLISVSE